jgi:hypothetical protein
MRETPWNWRVVQKGDASNWTCFERLQGALGRKSTFIERAKGLIDVIHAWHMEGKDRERVPVGALVWSLGLMYIGAQ